MKIIFLGTGTSHGVPMIACDCPVCTSTDEKNRRTRTSVVVNFDDKNILIDTSPELRLQAVRCKITKIDAILFTHAHADHLHGLDDVRRYSQIQEVPVPCYGNQQTIDRISLLFDYAFSGQFKGGGVPNLQLKTLNGKFSLFGLEIIPVEVMHGNLPVLGYRFPNFAYVTDCSAIPEQSMKLLKDLDLLILDALRPNPHPTHFSLQEALDVVEKLKPKRTYFVHTTHDLEYHETNAQLPEEVELAYDGLVVEI